MIFSNSRTNAVFKDIMKVFNC